MIKVLSFDLQGTISDAKFSDNFWIELLPMQYANKNNITLEDSKRILRDKFKQMGKYDILYYDDSYWAKELDFDTIEVLKEAGINPSLDEKLIKYINKVNLPKIILSTTTDLFINYELGNEIKLFDRTYSCVNYFNSGGKTKEIFLRVADELKVDSSEILHIGDSVEMDIENAKKANVNTILFDGNVDNLINEIDKYLEV